MNEINAAAFDRSMTADQRAILAVLKQNQSHARTAVELRCGLKRNASRLHMMATVHPLIPPPRLGFKVGVHPVAPGRWAIWLRPGQAPVRIARLQGWPIPDGAAKKFPVPEALRVITFTDEDPETYFWTFCPCGKVGTLPPLRALWQNVMSWRISLEQVANGLRPTAPVERLYRSGKLPVSAWRNLQERAAGANVVPRP